MTAVLPPPTAVAPPLSWAVTLALPTGASRTVEVADDLLWDGRSPAELALELVAFSTGVAAELWTVTAVYAG